MMKLPLIVMGGVICRLEGYRNLNRQDRESSSIHSSIAAGENLTVVNDEVSQLVVLTSLGSEEILIEIGLDAW